MNWPRFASFSRNGGEERDEQIEHEPVRTRVAADTAGHRKKPRAKFPAHGQDRSRLDDDLEDLRLLAVITKQRSGDDEVSSRGNREEFREAFNQAQQQRDE